MSYDDTAEHNAANAPKSDLAAEAMNNQSVESFADTTEFAAWQPHWRVQPRLRTYWDQVGLLSTLGALYGWRGSFRDWEPRLRFTLRLQRRWLRRASHEPDLKWLTGCTKHAEWRQLLWCRPCFARVVPCGRHVCHRLPQCMWCHGRMVQRLWSHADDLSKAMPSPVFYSFGRSWEIPGKRPDHQRIRANVVLRQNQLRQLLGRTEPGGCGAYLWWHVIRRVDHWVVRCRAILLCPHKEHVRFFVYRHAFSPDHGKYRVIEYTRRNVAWLFADVFHYPRTYLRCTLPLVREALLAIAGLRMRSTRGIFRRPGRSDPKNKHA